MTALRHQFLWFDLETTCLDPRADNARILEWALVLADDDGPEATFEPVQSFTSAVHWPDAVPAPLTPGGTPMAGGALRASCDSVVSLMHANNGLWEEVADPATKPLAASEDFLVAVATDLAPRGGLRLAGYSVHYDLEWAWVHLPRFAALLSHHVMNVSTLKSAACAWGPGYVHASPPAHRALPDVRASLEDARELAALSRKGWANASN